MRYQINPNPLDALDNWVRAELEIMAAEPVQCEGEECREEAFRDFLNRIESLRSGERQGLKQERAGAGVAT